LLIVLKTFNVQNNEYNNSKFEFYIFHITIKIYPQLNWTEAAENCCKRNMKLFSFEDETLMLDLLTFASKYFLKQLPNSLKSIIDDKKKKQVNSIENQ